MAGQDTSNASYQFKLFGWGAVLVATFGVGLNLVFSPAALWGQPQWLWGVILVVAAIIGMVALQMHLSAINPMMRQWAIVLPIAAAIMTCGIGAGTVYSLWFHAPGKIIHESATRAEIAIPHPCVIMGGAGGGGGAGANGGIGGAGGAGGGGSCSIPTDKSDIPKKLAAVDEYRAHLAAILGIVQRALTIENAWSRATPAEIPHLQLEIRAVAEGVNAAYRDLDELRHNYKQFDLPDISQGRPDKEQVPNLSNKFQNALGIRQQLKSAHIVQDNDVSTPAEEFWAWIQKLNQWRGRADDELVAFRRGLSR